MSVIELLTMIGEWYYSQAKPNAWRAYIECPICGGKWHTNENDRHNNWCWIPRLQAELEDTK
jgi:hypothetical protein